MRVDVGMRQLKKFTGQERLHQGNALHNRPRSGQKLFIGREAGTQTVQSSVSSCSGAPTEKSGGWGNRAPLARTFAQWRPSLAPLARTVET